MEPAGAVKQLEVVQPIEGGEQSGLRVRGVVLRCLSCRSDLSGRHVKVLKDMQWSVLAVEVLLENTAGALPTCS